MLLLSVYKIYKNPLEFLLLFLFFYSIIFAGWVGNTVEERLVSVSVVVFIYLFIKSIRFAKINPPLIGLLSRFLEGEEYDNTTTDRKWVRIIGFATILTLFAAIVEYFVTIVVRRRSEVLAVGFPYPIYSSVTHSLLVSGVLFNTIIFSAFLAIYIYLLKKRIK